MVFFKRSKLLYLQYCHSNYPIPEWSLQQVRQGHWQLWCLQSNVKHLHYMIYLSDHGMEKGNFLWKVEIVGDGYLVASGLPYPNGKQVPGIKITIAKEFFCLFLLVIDNSFYLDISARKRDFKHGHPADAGGQRVQGLIFQDKISNIFKSKSVFKSKIFPKVSHVRNYKMQMRMGIHSGWRHLLVIT